MVISFNHRFSCVICDYGINRMSCINLSLMFKQNEQEINDERHLSHLERKWGLRPSKPTALMLDLIFHLNFKLYRVIFLWVGFIFLMQVYGLDEQRVFWYLEILFNTLKKYSSSQNQIDGFFFWQIIIVCDQIIGKCFDHDNKLKFSK